jgi:LmbE family N-acetylglucosaminyl deacetylase
MRESGIAAAYAQLAGVANEWKMCTLTVGGHEIAYNVLGSNPNISVIFMRLPDGGYPAGNGNASYGSQSLLKLWRKTRKIITSVDGLNTYTYSDLVETLTSIMMIFQPRLVASMDYVNAFAGEDHMDHYAVASFSREAHGRYSFPHKFVGYAGYAVQDLGENVGGSELQDKQAAFYAYGGYDAKACYDEATCSVTPYAGWLRREYEVGSETVGVVADAGFDQIAERGASVNLDASRSSAQSAEDLTYEWSQVSGPSVILSGEHFSQATFTAPDAESTLVFTLKVHAGSDTNSSTDVTIAVI